MSKVSAVGQAAVQGKRSLPGTNTRPNSIVAISGRRGIFPPGERLVLMDMRYLGFHGHRGTLASCKRFATKPIVARLRNRHGPNASWAAMLHFDGRL